MAKNKEEEYVCTLCPELLHKAQVELNEVPDRRNRDIQNLREMVQKETSLRIRTDDAFLLRFLRARKFDLDRAFELIMTHYKMKDENDELFNGLRPSAVKHVLEAGITGVLKGGDKNGSRIMVFKPGLWDPDQYPLTDLFRTNFVTMSRLIEDEETQVNGIILLFDLSGFGWHQGRNMSPWYAKRIMSLLQDAFPARFKALHYLNQPSIFDYIFAIVRQFMKQKTVDRLHFHGDNYDRLKEFIEDDVIPEDYGGKGPKYSNEGWKNELLGLDAHFDEQAKYGIVRGTLKKPEKKEDAIDSMAGSYRKLEI